MTCISPADWETPECLHKSAVTQRQSQFDIRSCTALFTDIRSCTALFTNITLHNGFTCLHAQTKLATCIRPTADEQLRSSTLLMQGKDIQNLYCVRWLCHTCNTVQCLVSLLSNPVHIQLPCIAHLIDINISGCFACSRWRRHCAHPENCWFPLMSMAG